MMVIDVRPEEELLHRPHLASKAPDLHNSRDWDKRKLTLRERDRQAEAIEDEAEPLATYPYRDHDELGELDSFEYVES